MRFSILMAAAMAVAPAMLLPCAQGKEPALAALADASANATQPLQAALDALAEKGGVVRLPGGDYRITSSLRLPSGVTLQGAGRGATRLLVPEGVSFAALALEGVSNVAIRDLSLVEEGKTGHATRGSAVEINAGSRFILVENVNVQGFLRGFSIGRADKGESGNIVFRGCRAEGARAFGFDLNECREVLLDSCYAFRNWLDGIKLRSKTRDVTIRGGEASYNGTSNLESPPSNGNGVDAYAGGEAFLIDGLVTEHNQGSGLYMKTGELNKAGQGHGRVGNCMITNVRSRHNIGSGLDINRSGGDLVDAPLLANVTVIGGIFEENTSSGIYVRGRNVSIVSPIIRRNARHGIDLASAFDVDVSGAMVFGNGGENGGYAIQIGVDPVKARAARIQVRGGVLDGVDDTMVSDGDAPPATQPVHRRAVFIGDNATMVTLSHVNMKNWLEEGSPVESALSATIVNDSPANFSAAYGSRRGEP